MTAHEPRRRRPPQGRLECVGISGWLPSESPARMDRNHRLLCVGATCVISRLDGTGVTRPGRASRQRVLRRRSSARYSGTMPWAFRPRASPWRSTSVASPRAAFSGRPRRSTATGSQAPGILNNELYAVTSGLGQAELQQGSGDWQTALARQRLGQGDYDGGAGVAHRRRRTRGRPVRDRQRLLDDKVAPCRWQPPRRAGKAASAETVFRFDVLRQLRRRLLQDRCTALRLHERPQQRTSIACTNMLTVRQFRSAGPSAGLACASA